MQRESPNTVQLLNSPGGFRMASYLILWSANPAAWPTDPKQALAVLEGATAGGDMLLKAGALRELGWLSTEDGYAIADADSKDVVLGLIQPFFPMFTQKISEIVSWEKGKKAMLDSARQAASR
jgi:hypothetical protein